MMLTSQNSFFFPSWQRETFLKMPFLTTSSRKMVLLWIFSHLSVRKDVIQWVDSEHFFRSCYISSCLFSDFWLAISYPSALLPFDLSGAQSCSRHQISNRKGSSPFQFSPHPSFLPWVSPLFPSVSAACLLAFYFFKNPFSSTLLLSNQSLFCSKKKVEWEEN